MQLSLDHELCWWPGPGSCQHLFLDLFLSCWCSSHEGCSHHRALTLQSTNHQPAILKCWAVSCLIIVIRHSFSCQSKLSFSRCSQRAIPVFLLIMTTIGYVCSLLCLFAAQLQIFSCNWCLFIYLLFSYSKYWWNIISVSIIFTYAVFPIEGSRQNNSSLDWLELL